MDSRGYLRSYGWVEGEAFKKGGLKKPILVKHKKDTKGLGHDHGDGDAWWERVFDGQLKSLDVMNAGGKTSFEQKAIKIEESRKSPLYRMFVKGEGLAGTVGKVEQLEEHLEIKTNKANIVEEMIDKTASFGKRQRKESKEDDNAEIKKKGKKRRKVEDDGEKSQSKKSNNKSRDDKPSKGKKERKDKKDKKAAKDKNVKKEKKEKKDKKI